MKRQSWVSFEIAGVSLTDFGLAIPSPFCSLELGNSEIADFTSWTLRLAVGGDASRKINISAFEALLYSASQAEASYNNSSGIPVAFALGWLKNDGSIDEYLSYQGFTLQFKVSQSGLYMIYEVTGYASLAMQSSTPVLRIPELTGIVQPSAVLEGLVRAVRATDYYDLDIDHNDDPTLISHGALTTSFNRYVRGVKNGEDDFETFPGLLTLSKSYSRTRDAAGLAPRYRKLSQVMNNRRVTALDNFLIKSLTDGTPQCSSFSYWVDEPTMTHPGTIHYKSNAGLMTSHVGEVLQYGTADSNILSLSGSYNGVAYNMTDMNFSSVGFMVDVTGNTVIQNAEVVNSWASSLAEVFQTVNIINDVSAIASQFSGDFTVTIPGTVKQYSIAQPVSLIVMAGNTISPITGVYNIMSVTHTIAEKFVTTLKLQRLVMSSANAVASSQGIYVSGMSGYPSNSFSTTSNVISEYKVDFGQLYPDFSYFRLLN